MQCNKFSSKTSEAFWQCSLLMETISYRVGNTTTYRSLYSADFVNISPRSVQYSASLIRLSLYSAKGMTSDSRGKTRLWMKAYHLSEIPMIMGTHEIERGSSTTFQRELSTIMQTMLVDFAHDPERGLSRWGWKPVGRDYSNPMVLGKDGVLFRQREPTSSGMGIISGKLEDPVPRALTRRDGIRRGRWLQWIKGRNRERILA